MTGDAAGVFEAQRGRLFGLAYRLLGSASDAEDVLQDAFLRWDAADRDAIAEPAAWLTRVVTNLCLTELTSARQRRELYTGTWLPEPVLTGTGTGTSTRTRTRTSAGPVTPAGAGWDPGPLETAAQRESLSMALLLLCEQLTAPERAVFILHEAFGYRYGEIAGIIGRSEAACRQLGHRAAVRLRPQSRNVRFTPRDPAESARWRELTSQFLAAAAVGDVAGLERFLAEDVVSWSDGGGKVPAGLRPVCGRAKVARLFAALGPALAVGTELSPALLRRCWSSSCESPATWRTWTRCPRTSRSASCGWRGVRSAIRTRAGRRSWTASGRVLPKRERGSARTRRSPGSPASLAHGGCGPCPERRSRLRR